MEVAKTYQKLKLTGNRLRNLIRLVAVNTIGRGALSPLASRRRRDDNIWVIYGWKGRFRDNAKYFFLHLQQEHPQIESYFLTFHKPTFDELSSRELPCLWGGNPRTWQLLLRAGVWIVDHGMYRWESLLTMATEGCTRVMLWHGVPLKRFYANNCFSGQWSLYNKEDKSASERLELWARQASFPPYSLLISTSTDISPIMMTAFADLVDEGDVVATGYPRNDCLTGAFNYPKELHWLGTDATLSDQLDHWCQSRKVVLYMPTYREQENTPLSDGAFDLERLEAFCKRNHIQFLMKLHPDRSQRRYHWHHDFEHITWISKDVDIYPLLPQVDLLISDYSSITFDFLLLDRPVVLYAYDLEEYLASNRKLHFEYDEIAPGDVARNIVELEEAIRRNLENPQLFSGQRSKARHKMMGAQQGSASEKIYQAISQRIEA